MSPQRWEKVKQVLQLALEREPGRRAAFLDEVCGEDTELRREVASLIASYEADPDFIEPSTVEPQPPVAEAGDEAALVGQRIGPYRLVSFVACGGMGAVYRAVRADGTYRKQVAVKLLRADRTGDHASHRRELLRRFRTEQQALANLDHPNIAKLLDAGTSEDGRPYLVMDYIEGQPIDEYCDTRRLTTVERLRLFRSVCEAVHHAHRCLVVHRDLKPTNILVTADGTPKLLDFGIAKLIEPAAAAGSIVTQTGLQPLTPEYASPEQIRGGPITTASDVYSLGVVLYELLTGHRPYRVSSLAAAELARAICEQEPEKPSTAVMRVEQRPTRDGSSWITLTPQTVSLAREGRPDRLRRLLAGDLDMILLTALRKEPQRRYASAEQFSEDIRRHLGGQPVRARKDTWSYRGAKFLRRHRAGVAAAALAAAALLGAALVSSRHAELAVQQRDEAQRQRRAAEQNLARAEAAERKAAHDLQTAKRVADFLAELFSSADPLGDSDPGELRGTQVSVGEVLERGAEQLLSELSEEPDVRSMLMHRIGQVYRRLGDLSRAEALLQQSLEIRRALYGQQSGFTAESLRALAHVARDRGRFGEAESQLRRALEVERDVLGADDPAVGVTLTELADVYRDQRDYARSLELYKQAVVLLEQSYGRAHPQYAATLVNQAAVHQAAGELDEAERLQREALEILRGVHGDTHPQVAAALSNVAALRHAQGDLTRAGELFAQAVDMQRRCLPADHPHIIRNLGNLGALLTEQSRYGEAEPLLRKAVELAGRRFGERHVEVASALNRLGLCLRSAGRAAEAEACLRQAVSISRMTQPEHPALATRLANLAHVLVQRGEYNEASQLLGEALDLQRRTVATPDLSVANTLAGLGTVRLKSGELAAAEPLLRESLALRRRLLPPGHWLAAHTAGLLGECLLAQERAEEAEALLVESCNGLAAALGEEDQRTRARCAAW
jgi:serine/threonine protein kinase